MSPMIVAIALHHLSGRDCMMDQGGADLVASSGQRKVAPGVQNAATATYVLKVSASVVNDLVLVVEIRS